MPIELLEDTARVVRVTPERWWGYYSPAETGLTNPACTWLDSSGATVSTKTITHAAFVGPIATVTSQTAMRLTVTTLGPPLVGTRLAFYRPSLGYAWVASATVASVTANGSPVTSYDLTFTEAAATTLAVSDIARDTMMSVTLSATDTADRDVNYRLRFLGSQCDIYTGTYASCTFTPTEHVEWCHVVRHLFRDPCLAEDVRAYLNRISPSHGKTDTYFNTVASEVNQIIRQRLMAQGSYPHLFGDTSAFKQAGQDCMRWWLAANDGKFPPGVGDREAYTQQARSSYYTAIGEAVQSLTTYDADDDDDIANDVTRVGVVTLSRGL